MSQKLDDLGGAAQAKRFNWSGFYVGLNGGGAFGDARTNTSMTCIDDGTQLLCPFTQPQFAAIGAAGTGTLTDRGFTGGAQAGLNMQTGSTIFGLEIDVQSFRLAASQSVTSAVPAGLATPPDVVTVGTSFDTNWLFTARSRLGLAVGPNVLLYGTSGLAVTELGVRNTLSSTVSLAQGTANDSGRLVGWTVGGGAEWALNRHWSLRAEYLYLDFGKVTVNAPVNLPGPLFPNNNNLATTVDLTAQIVRGGLNYRF
jgi:outer membrane immunogenic protein